MVGEWSRVGGGEGREEGVGLRWVACVCMVDLPLALGLDLDADL